MADIPGEGSGIVMGILSILTLAFTGALGHAHARINRVDDSIARTEDRLADTASATATATRENIDKVWTAIQNLREDQVAAVQALREYQEAERREAEKYRSHVLDQISRMVTREDSHRDADRIIAAINAGMHTRPPAE
jgi:hypothetical protein